MTRRLTPQCLWIGLSFVVALAAGGCQAPGAARSGFDASRIPTDDNIISVFVLWDERDLWLYRPDNTELVAGFRMNAYFVSGRTDKGVFVPGLIRVKVAMDQLQPGGRVVPVVVYQDELDVEQAMKWRYTKKRMMGYAYGLQIDWPRELDEVVAGKEIQVVVEYLSNSGRIIRSSVRRLAVPAPRHRLPANRL